MKETLEYGQGEKRSSTNPKGPPKLIHTLSGWPVKRARFVVIICQRRKIMVINVRIMQTLKKVNLMAVI
jgi:hypothetical protein